MPRGTSSPLELAIEKKTTGASWPWNLSTVPTRTPAGSALARSSSHLGVVGRDDHDVVGRRAAASPPSGRVDRRAEQRARSRRAIARGLLAARRARCRVLDRQVADAGAGSPSPDALQRAAWLDRGGPRRRSRDEAADVGVHAPVSSRKTPRSAGSSRARRAGARAPTRRCRRGARLRTCGSCSGSPSSIEVARRGARRERVGERELAGLVDHEVVERPSSSSAREQPGGAGDERASPDRGTPRRRRSRSALVRRDRGSRGVVRRACARRGSRSPRSRPRARPRRAGCGSPCGSCAVTPTRRPCAMQIDDQARAASGLAGAGRPLDDEVALVESAGERALLGEVDRLQLGADGHAGERGARARRARLAARG